MQHKVIQYYSRSKICKEFSNMYLADFVYADESLPSNLFPSGEHAFQFYKYYLAAQVSKHSNPERYKELLAYSRCFLDASITPQDAKNIGGKKTKVPLFENELTKWDNKHAEIVQYNIFVCKLIKYPELVLLLLSTECSMLVHQDNRATVNTTWGAKLIDDNTGSLVGQNLHGIILMKIREALQRRVSTASGTRSTNVCDMSLPVFL